MVKKRRTIRFVSTKLKKAREVNKTRNKNRLIKYRNDDEYRDKVKANAREAYRKANNLEFSTCLQTLDFIDNLAAITEVVDSHDDKKHKFPVMSVPMTAMALQKFYQTIWRWVERAQIPEPILRSKKGEKLYHLEEVRIFVEEIGEHEKSFKYYRGDHNDVKNRIYNRVNEIRRDLKIGG